jgi:uncharacterized protein
MNDNDFTDAVSIQHGHYGRLLVARIKPNQDLATSLGELCKSNGFKSAVIRGVVGSLVEANLSRGHGENRSVARVPGPGVEILSVYGEVRIATSSTPEVSITGVVAGTDGRIFAGRFLAAGNLSFITIEASIQEWIEEDDDAVSA